jgi:glutamine amidotransferase
MYQGAGRCIVSEPFDREGGNWKAIPPASFVTIAKGSMTIRPFAPATERLALVG